MFQENDLYFPMSRFMYQRNLEWKPCFDIADFTLWVQKSQSEIAMNQL